MEHPILSDLLGRYLLPDVLFFLLSFNGKALILLIGSFLLLKLIKGSAANRHLLLTVSIIAIFLLPLTSGLLPTVHIPIVVAQPSLTNLPTSINVISTTSTPLSSSNTVPLLHWIIVLYFTGTAIILLKILWSNLTLLLLKHLSPSVDHQRWQNASMRYCNQWKIRRSIQIRHTDAISSPLTWGVLRPVVLIPSSALDWPEHLIRSTLLHEFAHIRRSDWIVKQFARIVCALYWINPLCWKALHKLSASAESACDDMVISSGMKSSRYAADLVNVAKQIKQRQAYALATLSMSTTVESEDLSYRVRAILNPLVPHAPNTTWRIIITYALVMCLFFPLSSLRAHYVSPLPETSLDKKLTSSHSVKLPIANVTTPLKPVLLNPMLLNPIPLKSTSLKPIDDLQPALLPVTNTLPPTSTISRPQAKSTASQNLENTVKEIALPKQITLKDSLTTSQKSTVSKNTLPDNKTEKFSSKITRLEQDPVIDVAKPVGQPTLRVNGTTQPDKQSIQSSDNIQLAINNTNQEQAIKHSEIVAIDAAREKVLVPEQEPILAELPSQTEAIIEPFSREHMVKPSYPRRAMRRGIEGEVTVQFDIDANGNVVRPKVINSNPPGIFDVSVLRAIKRYLFNPQRINGEAVDVKNIQETFVFVMQS